MVRFVGLILCTATLFQHVVSVQETSENYSCAVGPQTLKSKHASTAQNCEQIWTIGNKPIGRVWNGSVECHKPCNLLTQDGIAVNECVNITLIVLCSEVFMHEYRVHFYGMWINTPPGNSGQNAHYGVFASTGFLLLVVLAGLILYCYRSCHGCQNTAVYTYTDNNK